MSPASLPFELSSDSASTWLQSISQLNSVSAANQLNKVIKLLKNHKQGNQDLLNVLYTLTPTILFLLDDIEPTLLESNNDKSIKIEKLCLQLIKNTSLCFCQCCHNSDLSDEQLNQAIFYACQLIGYTQRLHCIFQEPCPSFLWRRLSDFYNLVMDKKLFDNIIKHKVGIFISNSSVGDILKRNLLFSLLQPYRYDALTIKQLYKFAENHYPLIELKTTGKAIYCWDILSELAPYLKNINESEIDIHRYIDTTKLINHIQSDEFITDLPPDSLNDSLVFLSGYHEIINSFIPSAPLITNIIVGQKNIVSHLEKVNKLNKIELHSSLISDVKSFENISLEPMEYEKNHLTPTSEIIPSNSFNNLLKETDLVKVIRPYNDQFIIADTDQLKYLVGELTLFCASRVSPSLGIIRQIKTTSQSGRYHILIEKLSGTPEAFLIKSPAIENNQCIVCLSSNNKAEAFLFPHKLYKNTDLTSNTEQSFRLNRIVESGRFFIRHQVSFDKTNES